MSEERLAPGSFKVIEPGDKLAIWDQLETTDPRFTKKMTTGAKLTTINGEYQIKRMTEVFGPCGIGWGFETIASEMIPTGTMWSDKDPESSARTNLGVGQCHTLRIQLWYTSPDDLDKRYQIEGVGHTPYIYMTQHGPYVDMEYEKKSLTDALTNAMAKLGMAGDVRMGLFDAPDYVKGLYDNIAIEEAEDSEVEVVKQRHEFEDWLKEATRQIDTAATVRELELIFKGALPRLERQGTPEQVKELKEKKDVRFRDLVPKKDRKT